MRITNKIGFNSAVKTSAKKSAEKKGVSDVLTEENIDKMRQIAYDDAVKGKRGNKATVFMHQCREQVAPDRRNIFLKAEKGMSSEIGKIKNERNIWVYLLDADGRFEGGSYKGNYTRTDNHTFIEAYDERGEKVGIYDSKYGWTATHTSAEKQVMSTLAGVYNETFNSVYKELYRNNSAVPEETNSKFNAKA
ncbi:MAG: hypothetical protein NC253_14155 [Ruminococcus sp.]|nr:hypothetical protein [Ruminococcus sp.]MCM1478593.1 hypothetical protein [Muribaculaceae bacterium]